MRRSASALVLLIALGAVVPAGCGNDDVLTAPSDPRGGGDVGAAVCAVNDRADSGAVDEAADLFWAEGHEGLHALARRLEDLDRGAAADLLRAKADVEAATAAGERDALPDAAAELERVTLESLALLDEVPGTPCS